jgi:hypothetical protein
MRVLLFVFIAVSAFSFLGCSTASKEIQAKSISERTDIFHQVHGGGRISPQGAADLLIKAEVKTNLEGFHIFESNKSLHGKPKYPFLFNIDGQSVVWEVKGQREDTPFDKGKPDGGEGMRYILEKRIRLASGRHSVFFALPETDYFKEFAITLEGNKLAVLELEPIYRMGGRSLGRSFSLGVEYFEIFLNGKHVWGF